MAEVINFALKQLKDTAIVKILDVETDEPVKTKSGDDMFLEVYSADSKRYRKVMADLQREASNKKNKTPIFDLVTEQLACIVANWNLEICGKAIELTKQNAIAFLDANPHVREGISDVIHERKNFL